MNHSADVIPTRPARWPRSVRYAFESIVIVFANAYLAARSRAAGSPSKIVRLLAQIADLEARNTILERELDAQRRRINSMEPAKRPHFMAEDRVELLKIIRYWGWSAKQAAKRLVMHRNTYRNWRKRYLGRTDPGAFLGTPPFNKISESVRWLVHEMHAMGVRFGSGTRAIAAEICRAGIQLSRSSVQRILREPKPRRPKPAMVPAMGEEARHILRPEHTNRTWHLDLATVDRFGCRFYVAALLDGYSRKILALKSFARTPTSIMMLALVRRAIDVYGTPRFLVCDHGCQFRKWFRERLESKFGVTPVSGKVRCPTFNGKCERFFKTFRIWSRGLLFAWFGEKVRTSRWFQSRLDVYRDWFNEVRTHQASGGRTPNEVWSGVARKQPIAFTARETAPEINVTVKHFRGDHHLPVFDITVRSTQVA